MLHEMTRRVIRVDIAMSALSSAILNTGHFPRRTESRLPGAALRPICKQLARPPQFLRPAFGRFGEHDARRSTKLRHNGCNESARGLLPERFALLLPDRTMAKDGAGTAGRSFGNRLIAG